MSALGVDFSVEVSRMPEPEPAHDELPEEYACRTACTKALEVAGRFSRAVVLGADTIVVFDGEIMGKPSDRIHAVEMLSRLCGHRHMVITGCCLVIPGTEYDKVFSAATAVYMAEQSPEVIQAYVEGGEPLDKAGSYAVQGCGAFMVERIEGSYTNVVGLPMDKVVPVLVENNILSVREV